MTDTVVPSPVVHELLNEDNYEEWSLRVETYLLAKGIWEVVEATTEPPKREDGEVEFKAWRKSNAEALHSIQVSCGADTFSIIRGTRSAKVAWDILAEKLKPVEASLSTGSGEISDDHTNNNPNIVELKPENDVIEESPHEGDEDNHVNQNIMDSVKRGDWDAAKELLKRHREAVTARIREGGTILHWAVLFKKVDIAKELVHLMKPEDLEIQDDVGLTALHRVITGIPESVQLAKCMVERNKKLLGIAFPVTKRLPLVEAAVLGAVKMAQFLYPDTLPETLNDYDRATLISFGFKSKSLECVDIACDLLQRFPELAICKDYYEGTPLNQLAGMSYAFLSGSSLGLWERMIYDDIEIEPMPPVDKNKPIPTTDDVCINVQKPENGDQNNQGQRHLICSGTSLQRGLVVKTFHKTLGFNRIYQMKLVRVRILEFLPRMCEVTRNKDVNELQGLKTAMFLAIKRGHVEYITHLFKANGDLQYVVNDKGMGIFQYAAKCRQHKVFSLLYELDDENFRSHVSRKDKLGNNMLHVVGTISSVAQINHIRDAALKMQTELQWFKEVERISSAIDLEEINHTDKMTPRELFTKGHKELVKEGEKVMKDTAKSCTVVGALIVTIMFTAAFTVPGGNKQDTGVPIFLSKDYFLAFVVLDVISFFFSTTSVMIFLGILTSRCAENDFLISLPTKMILGLITLQISIAMMVLAYFFALYIMLPGKSYIAFLAYGLAPIPLAVYTGMQLPIVLELHRLTYGRGMFDKKIKDCP